MSIRYAIINFIDDTCELSACTEHDIYVVENLYNVRPSKPYRSEGIGLDSGCIPEWVCVDLGYARRPDFVGVFNHNLEPELSGDMFELQACDGPCPGESGACSWSTPDFSVDLSGRIIEDFKNLCQYFECDSGGHQYWRLAFADTGNPDNYAEIGEWFLGVWDTLPNAHLQPGRQDGPRFFEGTNITKYGQIWPNYLGEAEEFVIEIVNTNDPAQVDALRLFLQDVKRNNGRFVFIPDDYFPFCYYVYLENMGKFGKQLIKGALCEAHSWNLELRTLTEGVALLG
jgi:hypothetical protein